MPSNFQVNCGSMVGENRRSPASTETPVLKDSLKDSMIVNLTENRILHKLRLIWNKLCCLEETSLQKLTFMTISYQEIIFHIYLSFS